MAPAFYKYVTWMNSSGEVMYAQQEMGTQKGKTGEIDEKRTGNRRYRKRNTVSK